MNALVPRGIALIAALDRNRAIGRDGDMPWHLPDDLKRFKALTLGRTVLMGRKTADAIGRALPQRRNLVLTRERRVPFAGVELVHSIDEALAIDGHLVVIGGGELYSRFLPFAQRMHLTHVDAAVERADTWFPEWDPSGWREASRVAHGADAKHEFAFEFVDYERSGPKA